MSLSVQFATLAWMTACGALLGLSFDTIGVTVRRYGIGKVVRALLDLLYWVAATLFVFRVLMLANGGEVRVFIFLGLASGAVLYVLLFGRSYRKLVAGVLRVVEAILRGLYRVFRVLVWRPLSWIVRLLLRVIRWASGIITRVTVAIGKSVLQWSKFLWNRLRKRQQR